MDGAPGPIVTLTIKATTQWLALVALKGRRARIEGDLERAQKAASSPKAGPKDRRWLGQCERDLAAVNAAIEDISQGLRE